MEMLRSIVSRALEHMGYAVDTAANGLEAVEKVTVDASEYACVLCDCEMPACDGYETARRIRAWEQREGKRRVPIVAMTANVQLSDQLRCLEAGMDAFLAKPVTTAALRLVLRNHSRGASASEWMKQVAAVQTETGTEA